MSVAYSSPYFFKAVSYALQKFQISHIYVAYVTSIYIYKGTIPLVYESIISCTPTSQAKAFAPELAFPHGF